MRIDIPPIDFPTRTVMNVDYCYVDIRDNVLKMSEKYLSEVCSDDELESGMKPYKETLILNDYAVKRSSLICLDLNKDKELRNRFNVEISIQGATEWNLWFASYSAAKKVYDILYDYIFINGDGWDNLKQPATNQ